MQGGSVVVVVWSRIVCGYIYSWVGSARKSGVWVGYGTDLASSGGVVMSYSRELCKVGFLK